MDTNIEYDLSQLQINYRLKLNEINQQIEQINENQLKSEQFNQIVKSIEDNLNLYEEHLDQISHQRQTDDESIFGNLSELYQQTEQIQIELKKLIKNLHQLSHDYSIEHLKIRLEKLQTMANDEYIEFHRLINEYKLLNQMTTNYNELNEQVNECIVNILQHADNRSRMVTPELEQRSPTDQLVQLNMYQIQVQEQLTIVERSNQVTSKFIRGRIDRLHKDLFSLKEEIDSILEKETKTTSMQMKVDSLIELLENEFDRQPAFSSLLTVDTLKSYEKLSNTYCQSIYYLENQFEKAIEQFHDSGLVRQYNNRLNPIKERIVQIESNIKEQMEHLQQGLVEQNMLQNKIQKIIDVLNHCENQLANRTSMKEYQIEQKFEVVLETTKRRISV